MNTLLKKALGTFMTSIILLSLFSVSVSAKTPLLYDFGCFTGNETMSVALHGDYSKFVRIEDENGEISPKNYTVSGDEQKTTITLKEEYLKDLQNGEYNLKGYFENILLTYEFEATENAGTLVPASKNGEFVKLTVGETDVDKSNYNVEKTSDGFVIIVKKDFLQTLPENTKFCVHYYDSSMCYMRLQVEKQETHPVAVTETTTPTQTVGEQQTLISPKTGDRSPVSPIIIIMLISAGVFTVVILIGSRKKSNK